MKYANRRYQLFLTVLLFRLQGEFGSEEVGLAGINHDLKHIASEE